MLLVSGRQKGELNSIIKVLRTRGSGYKNIATNLPLFHEINALPISMDIKRLDDGSGIENTLRQTMLNIITHVDLCLTTVSLNVLRSDVDLKEVMSLKQVQVSLRHSVDTVPDIKIICFFCEKDGIGSDRNAMTKNYMTHLMIVLSY